MNKGFRAMGAGSLSFVIAVAAVAIPTLPASAIEVTHTPYSVASLADSSGQQQRWLSLPNSRLILNPGRVVTPSADDTLNTAYVANGDRRYANDVVRNGLTTAPPSDAGLREGEWQTAALWGNGASIAPDGSAGTVTLTQSDGFGAVSHPFNPDLALAPQLIVNVATVSDGGQWAIKLADAGGHVVYTAQYDTAKTGVFAYDLSSAPASVRSISLYVIGASGTSVRFSSLSMLPAPSFADEFGEDSRTNWQTAHNWGNGATIVSDTAGGATLTTPSGGFGAVERQVTVDLDTSPVLTVGVGALSSGGKWALKLANETTDFATAQYDTDKTGLFSYDLKSVSGLSGVQTFWIKLYSVGNPSPTTARFTYLSLAPYAAWIQQPSASTNTWNPQSLEYTATFGEHGSYTATDVFVDEDSISRRVTPSLNSGAPTLTGSIGSQATWDAASRVLYLTDSADYTRAIGFPEGSRVDFFANSVGIDPLADPAGATHWSVVLPADTPSAVGFGYAVGSSTGAHEAAGARAATAASADTASAAVASRVAQWDALLAKVPVPSNFTLSAVDAKGVTPTDIEKQYYRAFVDLDMNVLPAAPEIGSEHSQMPVGKADTYYSLDFTYNTLSASWDASLALQNLVYVDPDLAWDIFTGMMKAVRSDGQFGEASEALPSRIAQTAWILYSVTGDEQALRDVYPALSRFLGWSKQHPQWNNSSHYPNQVYPDGTHATWQDERDAEFVVSLGIDYGFAQQIAGVLGKDADKAQFASDQNETLSNNAAWFFPNGVANQFYWGHLGIDGGGEPAKGSIIAVMPGLHVPGLTDTQRTALLTRFTELYNPNAQLAGFGSAKAPDMQYMEYGLLDVGAAADAKGVIEALLRDMTLAHEFSEAYTPTQTGPQADGERPSTFGLSNFIDNVWMLNGFRYDQGTPTFVPFEGGTGGVSGLHHLGTAYDIAVDDDSIVLSGDLVTVAGACTTYVASAGVSQPLSYICPAIDLSVESVAQGGTLSVSGSGFPTSAVAAIDLHSDPVHLADATTTANGRLNPMTTTIPSNTPVGVHTVVVTVDGVSASASITVTAGAPACAGNGSGAAGANSSGTTAATNGGLLAVTGGVLTLSSPLVAAALLTAGLALVIARRRQLRHEGLLPNAGRRRVRMSLVVTLRDGYRMKHGL